MPPTASGLNVLSGDWLHGDWLHGGCSQNGLRLIASAWLSASGAMNNLAPMC
jgi:hypothetical protein